MAKKALEPSCLLSPLMVALVSCQGIQGKPNIVTISWGGVLRTHPPVVGISIQLTRFSHRLISETGEFVINIPSEDLVWEVDVCGCVSGEEEDKFEKTGLTPIPSLVVKAPTVKECPVNLECRVRDTIRLEPYDFFVADVVATVADEEVILPGAEDLHEITFKQVLDVAKCKPLAFAPGGGHYWGLKNWIKPTRFSTHEERPSKREGRKGR